LVHLGGGGLDGIIRIDPVWPHTASRFQAAVTIASNGGHQLSSHGAGVNLAANPEAMVDYSWRAIGETYSFGRMLVGNFYGHVPTRSYFVGCSKGGHDAMKAAAVYPDNYDGVVAQAPAPHVAAFVGRVAGYARLAPLTAAQWNAVYNAYVQRCDANDGLSDGVVSNRAACDFSIAHLDFLAAPQRETVQYITSDLKLANGTIVNPRYWWGLQTRMFGAMEHLGREWLRHVVLNDPTYDPSAFSLDRYWGRISETIRKYSLDVDPKQVASFLRKGGKMLSFIGLDDGTLSIQDTIQFQHEVESLAGAASKNSRLFLMPGVGHCGLTGPDELLRGAQKVDMLGAMQSWVESGHAPDGLIAEHVDSDGKIRNRRPLCAAGTYPRYSGRGDPDEAESFTCMPERG
jgi:feruloyl esterase